MVMGGRMQGGWGVTSCRLVTVITLLAILELHNMVGVAGTQMPQGRLLQNCFKVWIVGIIFFRHCLFGDGQLTSMFLIMSCFPIFLPLSPLKMKEVIDS
jgi:hypothetical protein